MKYSISWLWWWWVKTYQAVYLIHVHLILCKLDLKRVYLIFNISDSQLVLSVQLLLMPYAQKSAVSQRQDLLCFRSNCGEGTGTQLQYSCLENPWTEEPGGLQSMGSLRVGHDWATSLSLFTFMCWRRKWQPTPVFLPGESQGRGSLVGCRLWGRTESDTPEAT